MSDQQTVIEGIDNLNKLKVVPVVSTVDEKGEMLSYEELRKVYCRPLRDLTEDRVNEIRNKIKGGARVLALYKELAEEMIAERHAKEKGEPVESVRKSTRKAAQCKVATAEGEEEVVSAVKKERKITRAESLLLSLMAGGGTVEEIAQKADSIYDVDHVGKERKGTSAFYFKWVKEFLVLLGKARRHVVETNGNLVLTEPTDNPEEIKIKGKTPEQFLRALMK